MSVNFRMTMCGQRRYVNREGDSISAGRSVRESWTFGESRRRRRRRSRAPSSHRGRHPPDPS